MNEAPKPTLSRGRLLLTTLSLAVLAAMIILGVILPVEFNKDPLGLGRLSGLSRLWAPDQTEVSTDGVSGPAAREYDVPFRTDVIEIPLADFMAGQQMSELEYKVRMKRGATLVYSWSVSGADDPRDIRFDQHGHTDPDPGEGMEVANYRRGSGLAQQGSMTAPFDGIQGWFFQNNGDRPVVIRLRLAGFYDLAPPGQPGNEAGIVANVPAAQARPSAAD